MQKRNEISTTYSQLQVGQKLGDALLTLARHGLSLNEVHLVGHSLGAHVMAYAGRWTRQRGQAVSR